MQQHERLAQLEHLIRRLRQRIFDYYDVSAQQGAKASRILAGAQRRAALLRFTSSTDEFGATAADRRALARHGIAWGD